MNGGDQYMIGIISYAAYLPRYRLNRMNIFSAMGWLNPALIMNCLLYTSRCV